VASYPAVQKTTNGGATWQSFSVSTYGNSFYDVKFVDANTGFITASANNYYDGRIFKSTNGGVNWVMQSLSTGQGLYSMQMINPSTGYVVGDGGAIFKTTTGGDINSGWIYSPIPFVVNDLNSVKFINRTTGWACGGNGTLVKSIDGGVSWAAVNPGTTAFVTCITFADANTGWFATTTEVKKTTDGGNTWASQSSAGNANFNSVFALSSQVCFLGAYDGRILRTTNGGTTWSMTASASSQIRRFSFIDNLTGWASGTGYAYKTTDGGATWAQSALSGNNFDVCFINANTGWIPAFPNVKKTTNGGATWTSYQVTNESGSDFYAIKFINAQTGFVTGNDFFTGRIYKTTNGGVNWTADIPAATGGVYALYFQDEQYGWAVGSRGSCFRTTTGGSVFVSQVSTEVPENFSLKQNYPNPFNPSTKINYELKITNYVSLRVFDLLGKEVASLVNEKQNAGSYAVDFNSAEFNLNSGIYFYTLNVGDFKETKKMMLVK